jgi:hypothetical protein
MINMCRQYYQDNLKEWRSIEQFKQEYEGDNAIHWYMKKSFIYKMVRKALRNEDINQLHIFRFLSKIYRIILPANIKRCVSVINKCGNLGFKSESYVYFKK